LLEYRKIVKNRRDICHKDSNAGNPPAGRGETTKVKVEQPAVANSRNKLKCCGRNSKTKVMVITTIDTIGKKEGAMVPSFFVGKK
jgi:hypothetical protein